VNTLMNYPISDGSPARELGGGANSPFTVDVVTNDLSGPRKDGELMTSRANIGFSGTRFHRVRRAVICGTPV
jgi:hypothetical protein